MCNLCVCLEPAVYKCVYMQVKTVDVNEALCGFAAAASSKLPSSRR